GKSTSLACPQWFVFFACKLGGSPSDCRSRGARNDARPGAFGRTAAAYYFSTTDFVVRRSLDSRRTFYGTRFKRRYLGRGDAEITFEPWRLGDSHISPNRTPGWWTYQAGIDVIK